MTTSKYDRDTSFDSLYLNATDLHSILEQIQYSCYFKMKYPVVSVFLSYHEIRVPVRYYIGKDWVHYHLTNSNRRKLLDGLRKLISEKIF